MDENMWLLYMLPSVLAALVYLVVGMASSVLLVRTFRAQFTLHLWGIYLPDVIIIGACIFAGLLATHAALLSLIGQRTTPRYAGAQIAAAIAAFASAAAVIHGPDARIPASFVAVLTIGIAYN